MSEEGSPRSGAACLSLAFPASENMKEEENARECERNFHANKKRRVGEDDRWTAEAAAAAAAAAPSMESPLFSGGAGAYHSVSTRIGHHHDHSVMEGGEEKGGAVQGWAKPGLGVCQLWAQQASSLKRKKSVVITATGDTHPPSVSSSSTTTTSSSSPSSPSSAGRSGLAARAATVAVGFGVDDPVPASREEKAKLVGGYLGTSRPGYGNEALKREWWPAEVPWLKGMSISQMNNATLHTLVVAVKAHQRKERHLALANGADKLPDGLLVCAPKTKKEMSRLIRSIQGRRLQYGKSGKCPAWWPTASAPWDSDRPLSTMKHGEVTSIFKAMVREGLLSDADGASSCSSTPQACSLPPAVLPGNKHDGDNDRGETTSEERSDRHSSSGSSSSSGSGAGRDTGGRTRANSSSRGGGRGGEGSSSAGGVGSSGPLVASHLTSYGNVNNSRPLAGVSSLPLHGVGLCGSMSMSMSMSMAMSPTLARTSSLLAMPGQQHYHHLASAPGSFLHRQREDLARKQQVKQPPVFHAAGVGGGLHTGHPRAVGVTMAMPPPRTPSASPSQAGSRNPFPAPIPFLFSSKPAGTGLPKQDELTAAWQDQLRLFDNSSSSGLFGSGGLYGATTTAATATSNAAPTAGDVFSHGQLDRPSGAATGGSGHGGGAYGAGSPEDDGVDDHMFGSVGDGIAFDTLL